MPHTLNILSSVLSSTLRRWRGTTGSKSVEQPAQLPVLFDREDDPECRLVREALTELNLDVMIRPCPVGGDRFSDELQKAAGGPARVPFLVDGNSGVALAGADAINAYLFQQYRHREAPAALTAKPLNLLSSRLASVARLKVGGLQAQASRLPEQPLVLYSFESSPYSRPVRERLCELQLPYRLVNLGKQQVADMGPASFRFHRGEYRPVPGTKRAHMLADKGHVQVPFLIDVNNNVEMFESKDILRYLDQTYAV